MIYIKNKLFALKQVGLRVLDALKALPFAFYHRNGLIAYWGFKNFGDLITPLILKEMGYTPIHAPRVSKAQFVAVGSILDSINASFSGVILGSGFLNDKRPKRLPKAKILAVRGKLTKELLGIEEDISLGDSGLLVARFITERPNKKYKLGIVPHYSDVENGKLKHFIQHYGDEILVIDVLQPVEDVFSQIASCDFIASSSLHGLVFSDSLNIPNLWLSYSDLLGNGTFKFDDYYSAFDVKRAPYSPSGNESPEELISFMNIPPENVQDVTEQLFDELKNWKNSN